MSSHGRGLDAWADALGTYTDDEAITALQSLIRRLDVASNEFSHVMGTMPDNLPNADALNHFGDQAVSGMRFIREDMARALRGFRTHERGNS
ncbi:hypothetical protein OH802_04230 [Nocardioides sp. NBC_00850]|uniref:hypothetical protein n=1 Tax=Nocardioides sp. NBC_00850 TaxID=2976001 RepID=UPI0038646CBF|nr:hypothetical protein OH802_04230 [Nocardioides sp. NBC_00850]